MICLETKKLSHYLEARKMKDLDYVLTSLEDGVEEFIHDLPKSVHIFLKLPRGLQNIDLEVDFFRLHTGIPRERLTLLAPWEGTKIECSYNLGVYDIPEPSEFEEIQGYLPSYLMLPVNPLSYPKEALEYCKTYGVRVIGEDTYGGELWAGYLGCLFPESFLQGFSEENVDIPVVPGGDIDLLTRSILRSGKVKIENPGLKGYSRDIHKLPALDIPPRKVHLYSEVKVDDIRGVTIGEETGVSDKFALRKIETKINVPEDDILWEDSEIRGSQKLKGVLHRYHSEPILSEKYNPKVWKKVYKQISDDFWIIKMIPAWYYSFFVPEHVFWLISGKLIKMPSGSLDNLNIE